MTHLNCAICKADYYVDAKGVCRLRVNDTNCEGDLPYDSDTCWECADDYYLNEVGLCVQIEEDNCA
ncbi:MAG: hypothetical protein DHS20C13_28590 [Thermodesulfobacteriota bacterium]|nr:MAG: hypothetical protein DHS20C13_28590 [Thermodesulfobacteriota bacterium]